MPSTLPNVIVQHVASFLWWAECKALQATSRACRDKLNRSRLLDVKEIIRQQLIVTMKSSEMADSILVLLLASRAQMNGSFVLQAMYGGVHCPWRANDIDILTLASSRVQRGFQSLEEYETYTSPEGAAGKDPALALWVWAARVARSTDHIHLAFTHVGSETGRNTVDQWFKEQYSYASLAEFVAREADFSFGKVLFDGVTLRVFDWNAVWTRSAQVNAYDFHRLPYYLAGDDGHSIVERLHDRSEKYRARGFYIATNVPNERKERDALNLRILTKRDLLLAHIHHAYEPGVPRRLVDKDVLSAYDACLEEGRGGEWNLEDVVHKQERTSYALSIADVYDTRQRRAEYRAKQTRHHQQRKRLSNKR